MKSLERAVRRMWDGERNPATLLLAALTAPAAAVFATGVRGRNLLYDTGVLPARNAPLPVLSVGNLAVGGTGKTPVAGWIVGELAREGRRPALVTRGYGEDELRLHRRWHPETPVIRASRRIDGARRAQQEGRDVVVLDDGFQHRGIARDRDIVLLSPRHRLPFRLLPRGPFREPLRSLRRADHVLVTVKGTAEREAAAALAEELSRIPGGPPVDLFPMRAGPWQTLDGTSAARLDGPPLVVTSVAEPGSFLDLVRAEAEEPANHLAFQDHHPYDDADVETIRAHAGATWVATTEKDAVKLLSFEDVLPPCRVLPLVPDPPSGLAQRLLGPLAGLSSQGGAR